MDPQKPNTPSGAPMTAPAERHHALQGAVHKALRAWIFDTLLRVGRVDVADAADLACTLDQVELLLAQLSNRSRLAGGLIEASAIAAGRPDGTRGAANADAEHLQSIAALQDEVMTLREAPPQERAARTQRLYRHLARFAARELEQMHVQESAKSDAACALSGDTPLEALHDGSSARLESTLASGMAGWMACALSPQELAGLLGKLQRKAPPEAVRVVLVAVRRNLDGARWSRLARALGLPPVPGRATR